MGEPDQYVHQTEGPALVGLAVAKICGHQLTTSHFAEVVRTCTAALKVWPQTASATLDSGLGKRFR